ncbi:hypothetical protein BLNAU_18120 [Blattamonas nauphoetae]|uniref:Uncharacterized protein n=1 Tax=Blattamonas nauphoetae TaxID=2049346 RepID=A0ABQ9X7I4_9EUKA|nr:hypothetical protein BLNAU_18120 [Blattamonas nauphoetae]
MDYQSLDFVEQPAGHEPSTTLVETSKHHRPIDTVSGFSGPQTLLMCDLYRLWHPFMISFAGMIGILSRQSRSTFATLSFFATTLVVERSSHCPHNTNPNWSCEHTVTCWERDLGASAAISPIAAPLELRGLVVERADASAKTDWFGEHGADLGGLVVDRLEQQRSPFSFHTVPLLPNGCHPSSPFLIVCGDVVVPDCSTQSSTTQKARAPNILLPTSANPPPLSHSKRDAKTRNHKTDTTIKASQKEADRSSSDCVERNADGPHMSVLCGRGTLTESLPNEPLSATLDMLWLLLLLLDISVWSHGTLRGVGMIVDEHCDERRSRSSFLHSSSTLPPLQHSIPRRSHTAMVFSCPLYCSAFMNWRENRRDSEKEKAIIFRSLVARVKLQPALDASLETKAIKCLESVGPQGTVSTDDFLNSHASNSAESLSNFVHSIVVLISSPNQTITTKTMKMLDGVIWKCSPKVRLALVQADLIPQIIATLNPLSLSLTDVFDFHINLIHTITHFLWLSTPDSLNFLEIEDRDEQQAVQETVLKQIVVPSEKYISHLCSNRFSIIDRLQNNYLMDLLTRLLEIPSSYQPTLDFVLRMPVILTIPSCLTYYDFDYSSWTFLYHMNFAQQGWNTKGGETRQMWKNVRRMLRMEGIEDVIEEKLRNDKNSFFGREIVVKSIGWNNLQGMNLPERS